MSDITDIDEIKITAVQSVNLWEDFLKKIAKDKKLSGRGKHRVSSSVFSGTKKESAYKKVEIAKRIVKNIGMGYGYMLSTNPSLNKKAVPVVWVGEEALTESEHFTMIIERGQAVIFGKGMKKCVFLSSEKHASGESLNFDERFGPANVTLDNLAGGEEEMSEENVEICETADFASRLWGSVIEKMENNKKSLPKEVKNGLSSKGNKKKEKAFAGEIEKILLSGQGVIYSTNAENNDREMCSFLEDVRADLGTEHCAMAVEKGKVTLFADGAERVVYLSERLRSSREVEPEESEG